MMTLIDYNKLKNDIMALLYSLIYISSCAIKDVDMSKLIDILFDRIAQLSILCVLLRSQYTLLNNKHGDII